MSTRAPVPPTASSHERSTSSPARITRIAAQLMMRPSLPLSCPSRYGGKLPEKTAVELVLHPFLCVLKYLHTNCVVHRDIKVRAHCENSPAGVPCMPCLPCHQPLGASDPPFSPTSDPWPSLCALVLACSRRTFSSRAPCSSSSATLASRSTCARRGPSRVQVSSLSPAQLVTSVVCPRAPGSLHACMGPPLRLQRSPPLSATLLTRPSHPLFVSRHSGIHGSRGAQLPL